MNLTTKSAVRLLALDIDGTLLTSDHRVTDATRDAIQSVAESGVHVVLASARGPRALTPIMRQLGISGYVIAYTGALICKIDPTSHAPLMVLSKTPIDLADAHAIASKAAHLGVDVGWMLEEGWMVQNLTEVVRREAGIIDVQPDVTDLGRLDQPPLKLQCMMMPGADAAPLGTLRRELPGTVEGQFSQPTYLEVVTHGMDKAHGLQELSHTLGIELQEMAALGDGDNDATMLETVGFGVAMGNATPAARRVARWITETNDQNGVALAIEHIFSGASA
jgi:Cof subfamily protein (haloacid dehalogenase superfamily)